MAALAIYGVGTLSAAVPRWLIVYAGAALAMFSLRSLPDRLDMAALALFSYMALSLLWAADRGAGAYEITNTGALFLVALWARHAPKRYLLYIPDALLVGVALALVLQWLFPWDFGGHGNRNFQTEAIILALVLSWVALDIRGRASWFYTILFIPVSIGALAYLFILNDSKIEWFIIAFWIVVWLAVCGAEWLLNRFRRRSRPARSSG